MDLPARHQDAPNVIAIERGKFKKASPHQCYRECRNINLLCIDYAFRPRLSSRLTLGRFALPRKPWVYGGQGSHLSFCYSCQHSLFASLHPGSPHGLQRNTNAPLPLASQVRQSLSFGTSFSPGTFSAQGLLISELLRYL